MTRRIKPTEYLVAAGWRRDDSPADMLDECGAETVATGDKAPAECVCGRAFDGSESCEADDGPDG